MKYQRLSPTALRIGAKRPEVANLKSALKAAGYDCPADQHECHLDHETDRAVDAFQLDFFGEADGVVGRQTWTQLLQEAAEVGWKPDEERLVHAVIAYYETGTSQDAYGNTSLLKDGAGRNYGVLQHNALGSLLKVLKMGGQTGLARKYRKADKSALIPEVRDWMRSRDGMDTQDRYYQTIILKLAKKFAKMLPAMAEEMSKVDVWRTRFQLLLVDCVTQNGALFSPTRKPFWWKCTDDEKRIAKYRELWDGVEFTSRWIEYMGKPLTLAEVKAHWRTAAEEIGKDRREVNRRTCEHLLSGINSPEDKLVLLAQWRARSSSPKWWRDVEDRRMLDATGVGTVHQAKLNLELDFGFPPEPAVGGDDLWEGDDD